MRKSVERTPAASWVASRRFTLAETSQAGGGIRAGRGRACGKAVCQFVYTPDAIVQGGFPDLSPEPRAVLGRCKTMHIDSNAQPTWGGLPAVVALLMLR
jgi:hypothetical protein